jgi:hypothetical protein
MFEFLSKIFNPTVDSSGSSTETLRKGRTGAQILADIRRKKEKAEKDLKAQKQVDYEAGVKAFRPLRDALEELMKSDELRRMRFETKSAIFNFESDSVKIQIGTESIMLNYSIFTEKFQVIHSYFSSGRARGDVQRDEYVDYNSVESALAGVCALLSKLEDENP